MVERSDSPATPDASGPPGGRVAGPKRVRPLFVRVARVVLIPYMVVLLGMTFLENSLIFFPSRYPDGDWDPPGLVHEDAWFNASDGTRLHAWYVPHEQPRAVVLFAHGNGGNLSHRDEILRLLHAPLRASVLIFDYRGYGRSEGSPSESGVLDDARAARAWLSERANVSPAEIVLMGESLGGAVAVDLAAGDGARGLILENTFSSLPDVAGHHYRWAPVQLLMRSRFDSVSKIGRYHGPLLQIHGDADTIVPIEFSRRLFAAANEPKQFVEIPGADHNDPRTPAFIEAVDRFLDRLPPMASK
jgi:fermentation-respiration switch protein FrsA (DUF1100 family)